jgi:hypothetical protein
VSASTTASREDIGNFGQDINDPWIHQHSNGFENATAGAANTDFIGPAIAIDEPGSAAYSDYSMRVRMGGGDNDGYGVLVRMQDDDTYYRVTFHADTPTAISTTRPPLGMSVQKVIGGTWSELYRDDQGNIPFLPPVGVATDKPGAGLPMFDVIVQALGNQLNIRVIEDDGTVHVYPTIVDNSSPLLTGTVGLHTWGSENTYFTSYGGDGSGVPLVASIPEPASIGLALLAGIGLLAVCRKVRA